MFDQARSLESAMKSSESYTDSQASFNAAVPSSPCAAPPLDNQNPSSLAALPTEGASCFFCGSNRHPRSKCPARDACHLHVKHVSSNSAAVLFPTLAKVTPPVNPASLSKSSAMVCLNGFKVLFLSRLFHVAN